MICNRRTNLQKLQIVDTNHIKRDALCKPEKIADLHKTPQPPSKMSKPAKIADSDETNKPAKIADLLETILL